MARRLISRVEESKSLQVQSSHEEIHLPVPLEPGQEVPNGIPQLSATAILHLEGGLSGPSHTEGVATTESPEDAIKAFLDSVIEQVVRRGQVQATPSESMTEMMGEIFKVPAVPALKKSLNEASKKGSRAFVAVKRSHPPSRGKDMRKVLKLAKISPSLFTPSTSSMARTKNTPRNTTGTGGKVPRKQLASQQLQKKACPVGGVKTMSYWNETKQERKARMDANIAKNPDYYKSTPLVFKTKKDYRKNPGGGRWRRLDITKNIAAMICSSVSCHSREWSERSHRITDITGSKRPPSPPSKKPRKTTWYVFSKTQTSAPSTPGGSPSCLKISS